MPDPMLSSWPTRATDDFAVVAPDGIIVHPIPLPGLLGLTLAEGRLPPGDFAVHAHRSLEQLTYVLAGQLLVTMGDLASGATVELDCGPGDTIGTPRSSPSPSAIQDRRSRASSTSARRPTPPTTPTPPPSTGIVS